MKKIFLFQFVKINTAYSVLGNVKEKRAYDLSVIMRQDPRYGLNYLMNDMFVLVYFLLITAQVRDFSIQYF